MIKTERDYQTLVMKRLRTEWWRWYKIPDVSMQIKPFDIIWFNNQLYPIAIELKVSKLKKWVSYEQAYKMLRPNQIWALQSFQSKWWVSWIRVYNIPEAKEYPFVFKYLEDIDAWEM
jgi:hypothetical protein